MTETIANAGVRLVTCGFCGFRYPETDGRASCGSCPLNPACGKTKCPRCGYEVPKEPGLVRFFRKLGGRNP